MGAGQSAADDLSSTPPPMDKEGARSGRVISPHVPTTPNSDHQLTPSGSLAAEKETSESALAPTAALSVLSLDSVAGVCVGGGGSIPGDTTCFEDEKTCCAQTWAVRKKCWENSKKF